MKPSSTPRWNYSTKISSKPLSETASPRSIPATSGNARTRSTSPSSVKPDLPLPSFRRLALEGLCAEAVGWNMWVGNRNELNVYSQEGIKVASVYATSREDEVVLCLCCCAADEVWAGFSDGTIKIFNVHSYGLKRTLARHSGAILSLSASPPEPHRYVFSASSDCQVGMWSTESCALVRFLNGHTQPVRTVFADYDFVYSAGDDAIILAWKWETGECVKQFIGHVHSVRCLTRVADALWSGSADGTIRVWDPVSTECNMVLKAHSSPCGSIVQLGHHVWSSSGQDACVWTPAGERIAQRRLNASNASSPTTMMMPVILRPLLQSIVYLVWAVSPPPDGGGGGGGVLVWNEECPADWDALPSTSHIGPTKTNVGIQSPLASTATDPVETIGMLRRMLLATEFERNVFRNLASRQRDRHAAERARDAILITGLTNTNMKTSADGHALEEAVAQDASLHASMALTIDQYRFDVERLERENIRLRELVGRQPHPNGSTGMTFSGSEAEQGLTASLQPSSVALTPRTTNLTEVPAETSLPSPRRPLTPGSVLDPDLIEELEIKVAQLEASLRDKDSTIEQLRCQNARLLMDFVNGVSRENEALSVTSANTNTNTNNTNTIDHRSTQTKKTVSIDDGGDTKRQTAKSLFVEEETAFADVALQLRRELEKCQIVIADHAKERRDLEDVITALNKKLSVHSATIEEQNEKLQAALERSREAESCAQEQTILANVKSDELRELHGLVAERDATIASLATLSYKVQQEHESVVAALQQTLQQQQQLHTAEMAAVRWDDQQHLAEQMGRQEQLERELELVKRKAIELDRKYTDLHCAAMSEPPADQLANFISSTRMQLLEALQVVHTQMARFDKLNAGAQELLRTMISRLHSEKELREESEAIQQTYQGIFQAFEVIHWAHYKCRQMATKYLTDLERLRLGFPIKGFPFDTEKLDGLENLPLAAKFPGMPPSPRALEGMKSFTCRGIEKPEPSVGWPLTHRRPLSSINVAPSDHSQQLSAIAKLENSLPSSPCASCCAHYRTDSLMGTDTMAALANNNVRGIIEAEPTPIVVASFSSSLTPPPSQQPLSSPPLIALADYVPQSSGAARSLVL